MGVFDRVPEGFYETVFHTEVNPSKRSSRTWESRTNSTQGHCSWHSLLRPRSSSALATRPGRPFSIVFFVFFTTTQNWRETVFHFFLFTVFTKTRFTESNWSSDCLHAHCNPSLSLTMGVIAIKLTIQVNIIPGLEPWILTPITWASARPREDTGRCSPLEWEVPAKVFLGHSYPGFFRTGVLSSHSCFGPRMFNWEVNSLSKLLLELSIGVPLLTPTMQARQDSDGRMGDFEEMCTMHAVTMLCFWC